MCVCDTRVRAQVCVGWLRGGDGGHVWKSQRACTRALMDNLSFDFFPLSFYGLYCVHLVHSLVVDADDVFLRHFSCL